jgi:2,3-dihydroxyphenylpropionate 1,2-dioxygenase
MAGLAEARAIIADASPDVAVVIGSNHFQGVYLDLVPPFAIGIGEAAGVGDGETPAGPVRMDTEMARDLAWGLIDEDFDVAVSLRMTVDHGITIALQHLTPDGLPIVPLLLNSFTRPLPKMSRCRALGDAVRRVVEADESQKRVAIIATGGLSHDLPFFPKWYEAKTDEERFLVEAMFPRDDVTEEKWAKARGTVMQQHTPRVNVQFDEEFLRMVNERDWEGMVALSDDELDAVAGVGAHELRSWVVAAATAHGHGRTLAYSPMPEWNGGYGVTTLMG